MAKIQRATQKIFAKNAAANEVTAFGTAKDNPIYNPTVAQIQTTIFEQGWSPSLVNDLAPFLQDSNALWYMATSQLAYLFQEGIAEWDTNTTYSKGALVKVTSGDYTNIYKSKIAENTNHLTSDVTYWSLYIADSNMAHYPIGDLRMSLSNKLLENEIELKGQVVSKATYSALWNIFGTTYGIATSTTFTLPNFTNRVPWGAGDFGYISAGLPDIVGRYLGWDRQTGTKVQEGAFYNNGTVSNWKDGGGAQATVPVMGFAASRSNAIYGNSNTVQPPAIKVIFKTRWR